MLRQATSAATRQAISKLAQNGPKLGQSTQIVTKSAPKFTLPQSTPIFTQTAHFSSTNSTKFSHQSMKQFQKFASTTKTFTSTLHKPTVQNAGKFTVLAGGAAVCPVNHGKPTYKWDLQADSNYVKQCQADEKAIYAAIEALIEDEKGTYDGYGNYGPLFIRLAWHASGTYDAATKTGGSNGACMRFDPESGHGANAGLNIARDRLEAVKKQFPHLSYADLYTFAGKVASEALGGPEIPFKFGRSDYTSGSHYQVDAVRLPDAAQGRSHVRQVFTTQMGFTDREIVALLGAHAVGKMHADRAGFASSVHKGEALPWTYSPLTLSNQYYTTLLEEKWTAYQNPNNSDVFQYENANRDLIMLPAEYILLTDDKFRPFVDLYAKDEEVWRKDFAAAFGKLLQLGVEFPQ